MHCVLYPCTCLTITYIHAPLQGWKMEKELGGFRFLRVVVSQASQLSTHIPQSSDAFHVLAWVDSRQVECVLNDLVVHSVSFNSCRSECCRILDHIGLSRLGYTTVMISHSVGLESSPSPVEKYIHLNLERNQELFQRESFQ